MLNIGLIISGSSGRILPCGRQMDQFGCHDEHLTDITDVVLSACASLFEMYAGLHCKKCRYRDVDVIEYLVHNAGFHHLRFMKLMDIISNIKYDKGGMLIKVPDLPWNSVIRGNKFHMLMHHLSMSKTHFGANLNVLDTEETEAKHKTVVKEAYKVRF